MFTGWRVCAFGGAIAGRQPGASLFKGALHSGYLESFDDTRKNENASTDSIDKSLGKYGWFKHWVCGLLKKLRSDRLTQFTTRYHSPKHRCGVRTEVRDRRTGLSFTQLCVGRMSDAPVPCPWQLAEGSIGDRVVFTHSPVLHSQGGERSSREEAFKNGGSSSDGGGSGVNSSFALVTILSEPLDASVTAELIQAPGGTRDPVRLAGVGRNESGVMQGGEGQGGAGQLAPEEQQQQQEEESEQEVAAILGPVVGRVEVVPQSGVVRESCRVPVVLEVDGEGEITCVVSFPQRFDQMASKEKGQQSCMFSCRWSCRAEAISLFATCPVPSMLAFRAHVSTWVTHAHTLRTHGGEPAQRKFAKGTTQPPTRPPAYAPPTQCGADPATNLLTDARRRNVGNLSRGAGHEAPTAEGVLDARPPPGPALRDRVRGHLQQGGQNR